MPEIVKKYLSFRITSVCCFIIALAAKTQLLRIYLDYGSDKLGQALMAKNYLQGHGLTITLSTVNDLAEKLYVPFNGWPPGYSFLLMPFLALSGNNLMFAFYCIDCITAIVFFIYLRKVLLAIEFPVWLTNLFILFQGFFLTAYIFNSTPTDFLATTVLLAALFYIIKITRHPFLSPRLITGLVFFLFIAAIIRYQNVAVSVLLTGVLITTGMIQHKKHWVRSGLASAGILLLACSGFLLYQHFHYGSAFYLAPARTGFFPQNLLKTSPFTIASFININFYGVQVSQLLHIKYSAVMEVVRWTGGIMTIVLLTELIRYWFKNKLRITHPMDSFMVFGSMAAAGTLGVLALLSLTRNAYVGPPTFYWTYVMAARYFAFVILFIQVMAWWWLLLQPFRGRLLKKIAAALLICTLLIEITHGIYFAVKNAARPAIPFAEIINTHPEYTAITEFIQNNHTSRKVVIAAFENVYGFMAGWYNGAAILTPAVLNGTLPKSHERAALLLVLNKKEIFLMQDFLKKPGVKLYRETEKLLFYTFYIEPSTANN